MARGSPLAALWQLGQAEYDCAVGRSLPGACRSPLSTIASSTQDGTTAAPAPTMPLFPPLVEEYDFEETGRGYRCLRDIAQGEELLAIPLGECWTAADARATAQLKPVIDAAAVNRGVTVQFLQASSKEPLTRQPSE